MTYYHSSYIIHFIATLPVITILHASTFSYYSRNYSLIIMGHVITQGLQLLPFGNQQQLDGNGEPSSQGPSSQQADILSSNNGGSFG